MGRRKTKNLVDCGRALFRNPDRLSELTWFKAGYLWKWKYNSKPDCSCCTTPELCFSARAFNGEEKDQIQRGYDGAKNQKTV